MKPDKKYQIRTYDEDKAEAAVASFETAQEVVDHLETALKAEKKSSGTKITVKDN